MRMPDDDFDGPTTLFVRARRTPTAPATPQSIRFRERLEFDRLCVGAGPNLFRLRLLLGALLGVWLTWIYCAARTIGQHLWH